MSSVEEQSELEANSWPGFVDILSAVIIMFVFFVLVTATALFFHTITYTGKYDFEGVADESSPDEARDEYEDLLMAKIHLTQENEELKIQLADLNEQLVLNQTRFSEQETPQNVDFSEDGMQLTVFYDENAITLNEEAKAQVTRFVEGILSQYGADSVELVMEADKNHRSGLETITRKVAIARLMNARNILLDTDLPTSSINFSVVEPKQIEGKYGWAQLRFKQIQ